MVENGAFSQIIRVHPNCITGSKVTAILLKGWILPIGGALAVKGLRLQPGQQACFYNIFFLIFTKNLTLFSFLPNSFHEYF